MTSTEPPTGPSAAKLGGYALLGVGGLAAVVGVVSTLSGSAEPSAAPPPPPPPVSSAPPEKPEEPLPPRTSQADPVPPPSSHVPERPTDTPPPPKPRPHEPDAHHDQRPSPRVMVRVYNNSTIKGLAHRAAGDFRAAGYDVPEVGNYARGRIYTTTVYFRPHTDEEKQAHVVAERFDARVEPRFPGIEDSSPGVIAIITNDYKGPGGVK